MLNTEVTSEAVATTTAAKLSPPILVSGAYLFGYSVVDWVQWLTLVYVVILIILKIPDIVRFFYHVKRFRDRLKKQHKNDRF
jgi:hypothetical protein